MTNQHDIRLNIDTPPQLHTGAFVHLQAGQIIKVALRCPNKKCDDKPLVLKELSHTISGPAFFYICEQCGETVASNHQDGAVFIRFVDFFGGESWQEL